MSAVACSGGQSAGVSLRSTGRPHQNSRQPLADPFQSHPPATQPALQTRQRPAQLPTELHDKTHTHTHTHTHTTELHPQRPIPLHHRLKRQPGEHRVIACPDPPPAQLVARVSLARVRRPPSQARAFSIADAQTGPTRDGPQSAYRHCEASRRWCRRRVACSTS